MTKCQCIKANGQKCERDASTKSGENPKFCWQHQNCQKINSTEQKLPEKNKIEIKEKKIPENKAPSPNIITVTANIKKGMGIPMDTHHYPSIKASETTTKEVKINKLAITAINQYIQNQKQFSYANDEFYNWPAAEAKVKNYLILVYDSMNKDMTDSNTYKLKNNTWNDIKNDIMGFKIYKLYNEEDAELSDDLQKTSLENTELLENLLSKIYKIKLGVDMHKY